MTLTAARKANMWRLAANKVLEFVAAEHLAETEGAAEATVLTAFVALSILHSLLRSPN